MVWRSLVLCFTMNEGKTLVGNPPMHRGDLLYPTHPNGLDKSIIMDNVRRIIKMSQGVRWRGVMIGNSSRCITYMLPTDSTK
mmetsp:Transcript_19689/g.27690  ORF Transcript_19689/g.27690 Transcript_19689/m.27690 type:complete len:82 (-) Transcript_19689:191-436(-)